ncbi:MAG: hypothetical protein KC495_15590 [Dehalococcoidia bacterium]|nr:hypothetical protein [Dehalococcoidia bacterium]
MATANFSGMHLNFQHQGSGAVSIHFDTEVVWSGTAAVVDIAKISHLLWSDTRMELRVRLTDANYQSLTDWSGSFLVAENGEACASAPLPQDPSPCTQSLGAAMDCSSRESVRIWAEKSTISTINAAVAALGSQQRSALAALLLDSNASGGARAQLLHAVEAILANSNLGFYAEIFAYTRVSLEGSGFFGACNQVWLAPGSFAGLNPTETRNVLAHEAFHSFNCVNRGPAGALNEGSAIFVFKAAWPGEFDDRETWAEATMGTKLYYRDLWSPPDPGYPIEAALSPTDKLNTVYAWLASRDGSRLPWNSTAKLQACYVAYFSSINRATAFDAWIVAQAVATSKMLNDSGCRPD